MPTAGVRRKLFNLAAAVSLCLGVATIAMLPRSYRSTDVMQFARYSEERYCKHVSVTTSRGMINVEVGANTVSASHVPRAGWSFRADDPASHWINLDPTSLMRRLGFAVSSNSGAWGWWRQFTVPIWILSILSTLLPTLAVHRWLRHRRRRAAGLCPTCGYDLRGPEPATLLPRCPECGSPTGTVTFSAPRDASPGANDPGGKGGCPAL